MSVKTRLSPREKLRIFLEALKDNVKVVEIYRRKEKNLIRFLVRKYNLFSNFN